MDLHSNRSCYDFLELCEQALNELAESGNICCSNGSPKLVGGGGGGDHNFLNFSLKNNSLPVVLLTESHFCFPHMQPICNH